MTHGQLLVVLSTKVNLLYGPEMLSSASNEIKLFAKFFSKNSNLDDSAISVPAFFLGLQWNLPKVDIL